MTKDAFIRETLTWDNEGSRTFKPIFDFTFRHIDIPVAEKFSLSFFHSNPLTGFILGKHLMELGSCDQLPRTPDMFDCLAMPLTTRNLYHVIERIHFHKKYELNIRLLRLYFDNNHFEKKSNLGSTQKILQKHLSTKHFL